MMSVTSVDLFLLDTLLDNFAFYKMDWFSLFVETDRCMTAASWNYIGCTCLQSLISSLYDISMLILPCTPLLFFFVLPLVLYRNNNFNSIVLVWQNKTFFRCHLQRPCMLSFLPSHLEPLRTNCPAIYDDFQSQNAVYVSNLCRAERQINWYININTDSNILYIIYYSSPLCIWCFVFTTVSSYEELSHMARLQLIYCYALDPSLHRWTCSETLL